MQVWGLTGIMGAGKSVARVYLQSKWGFSVADADGASRAIWEPDYPRRDDLARAVRAGLGERALTPEGKLDRSHVRARLVTEPGLRVWLEATTHPHILELLRLARTEARDRGAKALFVEGTRIIESGLNDELDGLICVVAPLEICLERIRRRGGMSESEALSLIQTQDQDLMFTTADVIWENGESSLEGLHLRIDAFVHERNLA